MIVLRESKPVESCLIVEGFVGRTKVLSDGGRQIMAVHIPGDFCDLHSYFLPRMDHNIEALSRCTIAKVPHTLISDMILKYPHLARFLSWDMAVDAAITREWMVGIGRRNASQRIAHLLCEMLIRLEVIGMVRDTSFDLPLTQEQLADATGLSIVHVNRTLQSLRRDNLISSSGSRISVKNPAKLQEAASFDSTYLAALRNRA